MESSIRRHQRLCVVIAIGLSIVAAVKANKDLDESAGPLRPNVVILFADNLGYADISSLGGTPGNTPNIDRLGREGLQLNHWNSAAHLCSASRATLLTGKYAPRTGVYPRVFTNDAVFGMMPFETTIADYLKQLGYATSIVGKWHLGHRHPYLPTHQGFGEWLGVPYHMSGGSLDNHICANDPDQSLWLPLYEGEEIIEQPVRVQDLAQRYANRATEFIQKNTKAQSPFFLYLPFSHVHQLCAPKDGREQATCQWSGVHSPNNSSSPDAQPAFEDAVKEMDWIAGKVLDGLDEIGASNNTLVFFTSDNGPWLAEQSCSGSRGKWEGRWLAENVDQGCTACPHDFVPDPTPERPRRCRLKESATDTKDPNFFLDGVHCGQDVGLGSVWEANLRMPAFARFPGKIRSGAQTNAVVSTLDVFPTVMSILGVPKPQGLDGVDISSVLYGNELDYDSNKRCLFFWRDGFSEGPLPPPYGRLDVAAIKIGHLKVWFWTKSAHYNEDVEVYHDPPLLFNIEADPGEAYPLDPEQHRDLINKAKELVEEHKASIDWTMPLALAQDPNYRPCSNPDNACRTHDIPEVVQVTY